MSSSPDAKCRGVKCFALKVLAFAAVVAVPLLAGYVYFDPWRVVRFSDDYFCQSMPPGARMDMNKGVATVRNFEHYCDSMRYNAFIFGSSISCYYDLADWSEYLPDDAVPYHFDSSNESLEGLAMKVRYLESHHCRVSQALVVLDAIVMHNEPSTDIALIDPPEFAGALSTVPFHYRFFSTWLNADFLRTWIPWKITGRGEVYGKNSIFASQPIVYDCITNQESLLAWDDSIATAADEFYSRHTILPYPDTVVEQAPLLDEAKLRALRSICSDYDAMNTDYRVVVTPNRRRVALSRSDSEQLARIFGTERFVDLSREMTDEMADKKNFYDNTHYRPRVAKAVMARVYGH